MIVENIESDITQQVEHLPFSRNDHCGVSRKVVLNALIGLAHLAGIEMNVQFDISWIGPLEIKGEALLSGYQDAVDRTQRVVSIVDDLFRCQSVFRRLSHYIPPGIPFYSSYYAFQRYTELSYVLEAYVRNIGEISPIDLLSYIAIFELRSANNLILNINPEDPDIEEDYYLIAEHYAAYFVCMGIIQAIETGDVIDEKIVENILVQSLCSQVAMFQ